MQPDLKQQVAALISEHIDGKPASVLDEKGNPLPEGITFSDFNNYLVLAAQIIALVEATLNQPKAKK